MKTLRLFAALLMSGSLLVLSACGENDETPAQAAATNTPTSTRTSLPTRTPTLTPTHTSTQTATATRTNTPTATRTPTSTLTPTQTATPTATATQTPTATPSPTPTSTSTPIVVPDNLKVPAGNSAFLEGHASGTQDYICLPCPNLITTAATCPASGFAWAFVEPQATLLDDQNGQILTHFLSPNPNESGTARPTWQDSDDSSTVWAKKTASADHSSDPTIIVAADAIPWFLLQVVGAQTGPTGGTTLTAATYVQRLNTTGGLAPATGCAQSTDAGHMALQPYTADYFFYKAD